MAKKPLKPATESVNRRRRELLASIERERRKKGLQELNEQFGAIKDNLTRVSKANKEHFERRMALAVARDTVQRGFRDALIRKGNTFSMSLKTKIPKTGPPKKES